MVASILIGLLVTTAQTQTIEGYRALKGFNPTVKNHQYISQTYGQTPVSIPTMIRPRTVTITDNWFANEVIRIESGGNPLAVNPTTGATGLCQSLPASKMATHGADYLTNPQTQLAWCNDYATQRYGSWENAYNFLTKNGWF